MADVLNHSLGFKAELRDWGDLSKRTIDRNYSSSEAVFETFGRNRLAADLRPDDFQRLRSRLRIPWDR